MKIESGSCQCFVTLDVPNEGSFTATCDLQKNHEGDHNGFFDTGAEYYSPKRKSKKYPLGCVKGLVTLHVTWPNLD